MITVDARCHCDRCEARTQNIYRMVGNCINCGVADILMLFREGDRKCDWICQTCGVAGALHPTRLASEDEIPEAEAAT